MREGGEGSGTTTARPRGWGSQEGGVRMAGARVSSTGVGPQGPKAAAMSPCEPLSVFPYVGQARATFLFRCGASHSSRCGPVKLGGGGGGRGTAG